MANVVLSAIRTKIRAAISGLSGLSTVRVVDASSVDHAFALAETLRPATVIAVICTLLRRPGDQETGRRAPEFYRLAWELVIVGSSYAGAAAAQTKTLGCDEVAERLLGLRGLDVKPDWIGDAVFLEFREARAKFPTYRIPQVGEVGWSMQWETTEVEI